MQGLRLVQIMTILMYGAKTMQAIHRANKKVPVDAIAPNFSAENIELLERFSPLLVQVDRVHQQCITDI